MNFVPVAHFAANALASDKWNLAKFDFVLMSTGEHSLEVLMSLLYAMWLTAGTQCLRMVGCIRLQQLACLPAWQWCLVLHL